MALEPIPESRDLDDELPAIDSLKDAWKNKLNSKQSESTSKHNKLDINNDILVKLKR